MRAPTSRPRLALALTLVLSALWIGGTAAAQDAPSAPLSKGEIKAQREFKMLDFNGDGKLSRSEVKLFPRLANAFDEADTDGDGYVSYEEVRAFAAQYRAQRDRQKEKAAAAAQAAPPATPAAAEAPETRP